MEKRIEIEHEVELFEWVDVFSFLAKIFHNI